MTPSDETLVSQSVSLNDAAAFAELMRRYQPKILLLLQRLAGEHALAEDLCQETFLRAWEKLETFRGSGSFAGWLATLAYNVFRANWRKNRRQQNEVPIEDVELPAASRDDAGLADLERLLAVLNRQDQVILVLNYAYGLSNSEVGRVLDMPAGTVKARIHRAKANIRATLTRPAAGDAATAADGASGLDRPAASGGRTSATAGSAGFGTLTGAYRT